MSFVSHTEATVDGKAPLPDGRPENGEPRHQSDAGGAPGEVLTVPDVARYLKLPISTIYALVQEGQLPGRKIGRQWRFYKPLVDAWLQHPRDRAAVR